MVREKELIERRVILPLASPQLAARLGLIPPRAVILFGPGSRKDDLRQGRCLPARLTVRGTVPLPASRGLAGRPGVRVAGRVRACRRAGQGGRVHRRGGGDRRAAPAADGLCSPGRHQRDAEADPAVPERDERLLMCATNSVRDLDTTFLRHGRYDYLIPVGPPDKEARQAIWDRYLAVMPHPDLDMAQIVERSRLFTPADIEFAARRTAQLVFERVRFEQGEELTSAADVLRGIAQTRRTLTPEMVAEFEQDIQDYARL